MRSPKVVWGAQPGSQTLFLSCNVFECLIEGNRGGGKSDAIIMDFAQHVGPKKYAGHQAGYGEGWNGVLFRRTYPELEDIVKKSLRWLPMIFPDAKFIGGSRPGWRFATGESLKFRPIRTDRDYQKYHGHEYPWIGFEELTNWPMPTPFLTMFSCCRSSTSCPLKIRSTSNPYGPGHNWVKKRYQLSSPLPGRIINRYVQKVGEKPRVSIHSDYHENKALIETNPDYMAHVLMAAGSEAQRRAWEFGDWNIMAGGMFDDVWNPRVHVVPSFPVHAIPRGWRIDRSYDHGSAKPFSVGWWGQSNGEPVEWGGRLIGTVPGDLVRIFEWYGSKNHDNEGLRLTPVEIAEGIIDREQDFGLFGSVRPGPGDDMIFNAEPGSESIDTQFRRVGVEFSRSNKKRVQGWSLIRQRLKAAAVPMSGYREDPGIFFCERCVDAVEQFPSLPRDIKNPDDVDTEAQDHIADEVRYRVMRPREGGRSGAWR